MDWKKYIKENQLVVMGVGIVILVNLIGGLIYLNSKPKNSNSIDVTPAVTPIVLPTETMGPTETPEPTATPWPTDVPTPKPTIKPTPTILVIPTQTPVPATPTPISPTPVPPTPTITGGPIGQSYSGNDCSVSGYQFIFTSTGKITYSLTGPINLEVNKIGGSDIFPKQTVTDNGAIPISESGTFNLSVGCTTGSGSWTFTQIKD